MTEQVATNPAKAGLPPGTNFIVTNGAGFGQPDPNATPAPGANEGAPATPPAPPAGAAPTQAVALPEDKTPEVPNPDTSEEFTYEPTGDAGLDYALGFIGRLGYRDNHPAVIAAQGGDFALIKAELAAKGVPGAAEVVALAEAAHARFAAESQKQAAELESYAAQAAGSAENWGLVRQWASANATPQEKAQVNAALSQGGMVAQAVIQQLVTLYQQQHTLSRPEAGAARPGAAGTAAPAGAPMTARAYANAVEELARKYGGRAEDAPEYAALQAQRLAARRAGY